MFEELNDQELENVVGGNVLTLWAPPVFTGFYSRIWGSFWRFAEEAGAWAGQAAAVVEEWVEEEDIWEDIGILLDAAEWM